MNRFWFHARRVFTLVLSVFALATNALAEKSMFQLFIAQQDTPVDDVQISVRQEGKVVGTCIYGMADKGYFITPQVPNVQAKLARCNFMLDVGKPALLLPNKAVKQWFCPQGMGVCQDDLTLTPTNAKTVAVAVFQGGAPLGANAEKPPKLVKFDLFLGHRNTPLPTTKAWIMQAGKQIGMCQYNTAKKGNFPLIAPPDVKTDLAWCSFMVDDNKPSLILFDGQGLGWHCPAGQFKHCQTDITMKPGEAEGGAVMVFNGGDPLIDLKLFVKSGGNLPAGDQPAVKLYQGFKEYAWCGPTSGGAVINGYRICEFKLPKGSYAVVPMVNTHAVKHSCTAPTPSGACLPTLSFQLSANSYVTAEVTKK